MPATINSVVEPTNEFSQVVKLEHNQPIESNNNANAQRTASRGNKLTATQFLKPAEAIDMKLSTQHAKLLQLLTPATRKLINKLKYFEMYDGKVYTVSISPNVSSAFEVSNIILSFVNVISVFLFIYLLGQTNFYYK